MRIGAWVQQSWNITIYIYILLLCIIINNIFYLIRFSWLNTFSIYLNHIELFSIFWHNYFWKIAVVYPQLNLFDEPLASLLCSILLKFPALFT